MGGMDAVNGQEPAITAVPADWLHRVVALLNAMAGDGVEMQGCADPAALMCEIAERMGVGDADDPWGAVVAAIEDKATAAQKHAAEIVGWPVIERLALAGLLVVPANATEAMRAAAQEHHPYTDWRQVWAVMVEAAHAD